MPPFFNSSNTRFDYSSPRRQCECRGLVLNYRSPANARHGAAANGPQIDFIFSILRQLIGKDPHQEQDQHNQSPDQSQGLLLNQPIKEICQGRSSGSGPPTRHPRFWFCHLSPIPDSRIEKAIGQIDRQVDKHDQRRHHQAGAGDNGIISSQERLYDETAQSREQEHLFQNDSPPD